MKSAWVRRYRKAPAAHGGGGVCAGVDRSAQAPFVAAPLNAVAAAAAGPPPASPGAVSCSRPAACPCRSRGELVLFPHASQDPHPLHRHEAAVGAGSCSGAQGWRSAGAGACSINTCSHDSWRSFLCAVNDRAARPFQQRACCQWQLSWSVFCSHTPVFVHLNDSAIRYAGDEVAATPVTSLSQWCTAVSAGRASLRPATRVTAT